VLTPSDIEKRKFEKAAFGYRPEEVDVFMDQILASYNELYEDKQELEQKMEVLAEKLEEYRSSEDSLRTVLLGAQKLGDNIIRESKAKAEVLMQEATAKSEAMVHEATSRSESLLAEAAAAILHEKETLENIRHEVTEFKGRLLAMYRQHLELIAALPEEDEEQEEEAPSQQEEEQLPMEDLQPVEESNFPADSDEESGVVL